MEWDIVMGGHMREHTGPHQMFKWFRFSTYFWKSCKSWQTRKTSKSSSGAKHTQYFSHKGRNGLLEVTDLPPLAYLAEVAEADAYRSATFSSAENSLSIILIRKFIVKEEPPEEVHHMQPSKTQICPTNSWKSPAVGVSFSLQETKNVRKGTFCKKRGNSFRTYGTRSVPNIQNGTYWTKRFRTGFYACNYTLNPFG